MNDSSTGALPGAAPAVETTSPFLGPWALPSLVFAAVILALFVLAPKGTSIDFAVFRRAGERFLHGDDLYRGDEFFFFKYAPIAAAFFVPFALLPHRLGWLLLNLLSGAVLLAVLRWAMRRFRPVPRSLELSLVLAMSAPYYGHLFWLGQTDALLLGLAVASESEVKRRPLLSGALWALACIVKPPFLVLLLPSVVQGQWRRIAAFAAAVPFCLAAGAIRYGVGGGLRQLSAWYLTLGGQAPDLVCWEFNQSAFALSCTWFGPPGSRRFLLGLAFIAALVLAAGGAAAAMAARADRERGSFALVAFSLYLVAFLSPLGWNTNLLAALPLASALAFVATEEREGPLRWWAAGAAVIVTLANCADLLLLPFGLWEDTAMTLLYYRQYALAGLVLAAASMICLALSRSRGFVDSRGASL
jgi:alpha-1,2-mannosyltransferase